MFTNHIIPFYIAIFLICAKRMMQFTFQIKDRINGCMRAFNNLPGQFKRVFDIISFPGDQAIIFCKEFGQAAFPESMNTMLICKLAIMISSGMQRYTGIGNIMPQIARVF
ncbi:hypothetical protein D9M68_552280 [compost metagenome]